MVGRPLRAASTGWCDVAQAIGKKTQGPLGGNARIELAHGTRCSVAWIDKGFFALGACGDALALPLIQRLEVVAAHVHLAAHFEHGRRIAGQAQRNLSDGSDVGRDLFARFTISPSGRLNQNAVFIAQAHGQAIKFELAHINDSRIGLRQAQLFADAGVKGLGSAGFGVGFGSDAEHGHPVGDLGKSVEHGPAHTLSGRIGSQQFGMGQLKRLQLPKQAVVFGIGDFRRIERVIRVCMVMQLAAQRLRPTRWGLARWRS